MTSKTILITGSGGYIGSLLIKRLARHLKEQGELSIIAVDVKPTPEKRKQTGVIYKEEDVRSEALRTIIKDYQVDTVVHLASIVTPGRKSNRDFEYSVDVLGTENVLKGCTEHEVEKIILTSSGAAYGYHSDNPDWITEEDPIRGNQSFAYAYHKRLVEEMLRKYRHDYPNLQQTIFRIGTILGETVNNQITNLFTKRLLIGVQGSDSPFVFIWDQDVVECLYKAIVNDQPGIYNLAGDGALTIDDIASLLNKRVIRYPVTLLVNVLKLLKGLKLTQYGPEQVDFIRFRPVLDNHKLKNEFGYTPQFTSLDVFKKYVVPKAKR